MDNVTTAFHNLITDGVTPQVLVLVECDATTSFTGNVYLSCDGDMTSDGATFVDEMTSSENYGIGCVPSRTMSVSLMNLDGYLNGHNFGWLQAYIGVRYGENTYTVGASENCRISYSTTYYGKTDGFYAGSTLVISGNCVGLFSLTDGYVYAFMESNGVITAYKYKASDGTYAVYKGFTQAMLEKFSSGRGYRINGSGYLYSYFNGKIEQYYLACLGHFKVGRPRKTLGKTIEISDAFDLVHELDVDASPILASFYGNSGYALINTLCNYCGLYVLFSSSAVSDRLKGLVLSVESLLNNSYSCRRVISYLLEAVGCNARLKPKTRDLYVYLPDGEFESKSYPITADRIAAGSIEVQEFTIPRIDCVSVKTLQGDTLIYPFIGGESVYEYDGNPFVNEATQDLFMYLYRIPSYTPMTLSVIEADPSFQAGDLVKISLTYGDDETLTTYGGESITTYDGNEIVITPSAGIWTVPLISQTIRWNGKASAEYDIKGSLERTGASNDYYTDTNARTTKQRIAYGANDNFVVFREDDALHGIYLLSAPNIMQLVWGDNMILMSSAGTTISGENDTVQIPSDLTLGNHSSPVGSTILQTLTADVSLSAQTTACTQLLSFNLDPGTWVVVGQVEFSAVVSRKVVTISPTSGAYHTNYARNDSDTSVSQTTNVQCHVILTPTATTTYYLNANSSAACSAKATYTFVNAVRIA